MTYRPYSEIVSSVGGIAEISYDLTNNTGAPIAPLIPVCADASGGIKLIDVSNESDVLSIIGVTKLTILNATSGEVVTLGRIKNVAGFALKDAIWVSKSGGLTNIPPEVGVAGFVANDFAIKIGTIVKNQTNPLLTDLLINIDVIGQLV